MSMQDQVARSRELLAGLAEHGADVGPVLVGQDRLSEAELTKILQVHLDAAVLATKMEALYRDAVRKLHDAAGKAHEVALAVEAKARSQLGPTNVVALARYGIAPKRKPGPKTVAAKVEGGKKGRLTRVLRETKGTRQRKKVKA